MDCSTPGLPVHHQLPELTQTHVHWVSDAIQPSHPRSSPSPSAFNLSQHQGLFKWVRSSHQVAEVLVSASVSVLPMNIQDRSPLGWTGWLSLQSKELSRVFSNTTVQKHQFFGAQLSLYQKDPLYTRLRISQFSNLIRSNLRSNLIRLSQYFINMCVGQPYKINMLSANFKPVIVLSQKRKWKSLSPVGLVETPWTVARPAPLSMRFSRQEYWSGLPALLQGIVPTQWSNPGLQHCRQILYYSNYPGSPTEIQKLWIKWALGISINL